MRLVNRRGIWYAVGMIRGTLYRFTTGCRVESLKGSIVAPSRAAKRKLVEIEARLLSAEHARERTTVPTLREYWLETYEPTYTVTKRAPRLDRQMMAHALPLLGDLRLDQVTTSHCVAYMNHRRKATHANPNHTRPKLMSEGTVQRERGFLQAVFQRAEHDRLIDRNPWKSIERTPYVVKDRVVTDADLKVYLPQLNAEYQRMVRVLLGTGLRLDEMRGIDPKADLDLKQRLITVRERRDASGELITRVKLGKTRVVPIPIDIVPDFKQQLKAHGRLWTQCQAQIRDYVGQAAKRAGIAHISPHTFRHTFGHRYLKGGGDIYGLAQILGDTVAVVEKHYAQLLNEDLRAKVDAVDLGLRRAKVLKWTRKAAER